jgi:molybdopterin converting factor small subunit
MPRVIREQDSQLHHYEPIEVESGRTVGEVREELVDELSLRRDMLALVNGQPASDNTVLKDEDSLYFKESQKARG